MKSFLAIVMGLFIYHSVYSNNGLKLVREYYYGVSLDELNLKEFQDCLDQYGKDAVPEIEGYRAMICFLQAKFYFNPIKKWHAFKEGREKLEALINLYPNNLELHFLRLTIQDNVPDFLGYHHNKNEDIKKLYQGIESVTDEDLKSRIVNYFRYQSMNKLTKK